MSENRCPLEMLLSMRSLRSLQNSLSSARKSQELWSGLRRDHSVRGGCGCPSSTDAPGRTPEAYFGGGAGIWFGGKQLPLNTFEKNGPGSIFGRKLLKLNYPRIYQQHNDSVKADSKTPRWGWHSSDARKQMMLGEYREALKMATVINPCKEGLDEALDYTYDEAGKVQAGLKVDSESDGGSALHGDHVIADGLVVLGRKDLPKNDRPVDAVAPQGSFAARRMQARKLAKDREAWTR